MNKFLIFSAVGAAIATGAYIFWKPSRRRRYNKCATVLCGGLYNLGNSCFVNAVLQALAACPSTSTWLQKFVDRTEQSETQLAYTLLSILSGINNDSEDDLDTYSTAPLLSDLRRRRWMISAEEQDAHEFFHVVMETLDEEMVQYPKVISLFDTKTLQNPCNKYQSDCSARTRSAGQLPLLPDKCADNPFHGLLATQLQCLECSYQHPVKYESFDSLSLPIPASTWGSVTLKDLLTNFLQSERVTDVECPGCAKLRGCSSLHQPRTNFIKKTTLAKLPQCLCIHIKRMIWLDDGRPMKCFNRVIVPDILGLDDYTYIKSAWKRPLGLCGGNSANRPQSLQLRSRFTINATDLSPPMTLLRALNFQSLSPSNSFLLQSPSTVAMTTANSFTDINQNMPNITDDSRDASYQKSVEIQENLLTTKHSNQPNVSNRQKMYMSNNSQYSNTRRVQNNTNNLNANIEYDGYITDPNFTMCNDYQYRLTAKVCHYGDITHGHFVTCRRAPTKGEISNIWLYTSDADVSIIDWHDVHNMTDAYMIFFERV